jgi:hypothetical protein
MTTFEFSDGFDAVAWHMERMSRPDYDDYYDEAAWDGEPLNERPVRDES